MQTNGYGHVNSGENYYDRRLRERHEKRERQTREALAAQREHRQAAQQRSEGWDAWFHVRFFAEIDPVLEAVGQTKAELQDEFDDKLAALERRVEALENQLSLNSRFNELERNLDARQAARDQAKKGAKGEVGARGAPGPRGDRGPAGPAGPPGLASAQITAWKIDKRRYRAIPFYSDGKPGPAIELRDMFERFLNEMRDA